MLERKYIESLLGLPIRYTCVLTFWCLFGSRFGCFLHVWGPCHCCSVPMDAFLLAFLRSKCWNASISNRSLQAPCVIWLSFSRQLVVPFAVFACKVNCLITHVYFAILFTAAGRPVCHRANLSRRSYDHRKLERASRIHSYCNNACMMRKDA